MPDLISRNSKFGLGYLQSEMRKVLLVNETLHCHGYLGRSSKHTSTDFCFPNECSELGPRDKPY
jgi:hypothetical protein